MIEALLDVWRTSRGAERDECCGESAAAAGPLHTCKIKSPNFSLWSGCEMSACVISECSEHRGNEGVSPPKTYADGG